MVGMGGMGQAGLKQRDSAGTTERRGCTGRQDEEVLAESHIVAVVWRGATGRMLG